MSPSSLTRQALQALETANVKEQEEKQAVASLKPCSAIVLCFSFVGGDG